MYTHEGLVRAVYFHCVSFVHAQRVVQGCLFSLCVLYMHKGLVRAVYFHCVSFVHAQRDGQGCLFSLCEFCTRTKGWSGLFIFIVSFVHAQRVGQSCLFSLYEFCTCTKGWSGLTVRVGVLQPLPPITHKHIHTQTSSSCAASAKPAMRAGLWQCRSLYCSRSAMRKNKRWCVWPNLRKALNTWSKNDSEEREGGVVYYLFLCIGLSSAFMIGM